MSVYLRQITDNTIKKDNTSKTGLMTPAIGVRLFKFIEDAVDIESVDAHFWTDSSTVLVGLNDKSDGQCSPLIE